MLASRSESGHRRGALGQTMLPGRLGQGWGGLQEGTEEGGGKELLERWAESLGEHGIPEAK